MKLTYWYSRCESDSNCYSIRTRTKRECIQLRKEATTINQMGPITKVVIEYKDGFDLLLQATGEGGIFVESYN